MPKILYLVTEDWFFVSHFLPMAQAARDCGLQVVVAKRVRADCERLEAEGFSVIAIENRRGSFRPLWSLLATASSSPIRATSAASKTCA